jgi:hydroxymethylbilane synthase
MKIRIGTRASHLARTQAHEVERLLNIAGIETAVIIVKTVGDLNLNKDFAQIGTQGIFVKELELALLKNEIDIAVHSAKDLPIDIPESLGIHAYLKRTDPADIIVNKLTHNIEDLINAKATIGTSSTRRKVWIENLYPSLKIQGLRGNVPTRLKAIDHELNSIIIAKAGLDRLINSQLNDLPSNIFDKVHCIRLDPSIFIPPAGQGAIAIECVSENKEVVEAVSRINDVTTNRCITDERTLMKYLDGGCNAALGIYVKHTSDTSHFELSLMHQINKHLVSKKYNYTELKHIEESIIRDIAIDA